MRKINVDCEVIVGNTPKIISVDIVMSDCPFDFIKGNLRYRYLEDAVRKEMKEGFTRIRTFDIVKTEQTEEKASFYKKSIFEMDKKELRDFCCEFCYMNIDTKKQLQKVQEATAEEWLKRKHKYKDISETAFYFYNAKDNSYFVDYDLMRDSKSKALFVVNFEDKPQEKIKNFKTSKITIEEMLEKASNKQTNKTVIESKNPIKKNLNGKKAVELNEDDDGLSDLAK